LAVLSKSHRGFVLCKGNRTRYWQKSSVPLRLFSKIRHSLLEGTSGKYFKYAIGEVILIVLGIIVALQIDNWNQNRQDGEKEQVLLSQLHLEFSAGLQQLENKMVLRSKLISSAKWLLEKIDQGGPFEEIDPDTLTFHIQRTLFGPTFNANSEGFFLSRNLNLIRNDSLRMLLADWPNKLEQLSEDEKVWTAYIGAEYQPFLIENYTARNLFNTTLLDMDALRRVRLDSLGVLSEPIGNTQRDIDIAVLMDNRDFEDHLAFAIFFNNLLNIQSGSIEDLIERILKQIES
jgi:hypothetical protein